MQISLAIVPNYVSLAYIPITKNNNSNITATGRRPKDNSIYTCEASAWEVTVMLDAEVKVVETLDTLVIALRFSLFFVLQRPMMSGSIPRRSEPKPNTNIEPTLASRRIVEGLRPDDAGVVVTAGTSMVLYYCTLSSMVLPAHCLDAH